MMSKEIQPPPGYTSTPPTEEGWYKVWCADFYKKPFRVVEVWGNPWGKELLVNGSDVRELDGWHWYPAKIEFL